MRKNALFQLVTALEPPGAPRKEDVEFMCGMPIRMLAFRFCGKRSSPSGSR
jgi:hypothetical protein